MSDGLKNKQKRVRVLLQNPLLAPYRVPVLKAISKDPRVHLTVAVGEAQAGTALEGIMDHPDIYIIGIKNHWIGKPHILNVQSGLLRLVRLGQYKAVILGLDPRYPMNLIAAFIARRNGTKVIWWGHGIRPSGRFVGLYKAMVKFADATILYNQPAKDRFVTLGIPGEKLFVAWNSIATEDIATLSRPYGHDRDMVLCVGRLISEKKVQLLIRAFHQALSKGLKAKLAVIGTGPELESCKSLVSKLNIEDLVQFPGAIYNEEELAAYFNQAFVSVCPGTVGLNAIHSLAYGVPVLAADKEPHGPEIIAVRADENAMYFTSDSEEELADKLLTVRNDAPKLAQMSKNAIDYIQANFSTKKMADNMIEAVVFTTRNSNPD